MIRVLVVDDSSFMRKSLTHILESDSSIEVVAAASDGEDAIRKVKQMRPDVVLLDIAMPVMDGLTVLSHIMAEQPTPVLVLSGIKDSKTAIKSLALGAVDFIRKPSGVISYDILKIKDEIIYKVKGAFGANIRKLEIYAGAPFTAVAPILKREAKGDKQLVVIGASTGGPSAVINILSAIPRNISAGILVVQHMAPEFVPSFVERLQWVSCLDVSIALEGDVIMPGKVLVSDGGINTIVVRDKNYRRIHLDKRLSSHAVVPSIDFAMESAALEYKRNALGVLLTGMGSDGAEGMKAIHDAGGHTIAEDESTCVVFGMPKAAIETDCVDEVLPLPKIAEAIVRSIYTEVHSK